jgi:hypothetical protein
VIALLLTALAAIAFAIAYNVLGPIIYTYITCCPGAGLKGPG